MNPTDGYPADGHTKILETALGVRAGGVRVGEETLVLCFASTEGPSKILESFLFMCGECLRTARPESSRLAEPLSPDDVPARKIFPF